MSLKLWEWRWFGSLVFSRCQILSFRGPIVETHDPDKLLRADKVTISSVRVKDFSDLSTTSLLFLTMDLLPLGSDGTWSWVKLRYVQHRELMPTHQVARLFVVVRLFGREAADDVGGQGHGGHGVSEEVAHLVELFDGVLAVHFVEHWVRAALDGHVQELVDPGVLHDVRHGLQVFEDVGRVGHAKSEHAVVGHDLDDALEKVGQVRSNVTSVRSCVFAGQPDLHNALANGSPCSFHDRIGVIGAKLTAGMARLAVGAGAEASCGEGNDFDESILPNLGKVKHRELFLGEKADDVALEGFFHDFDHPVDLGHSKDAHRLESFQVPVALGDAA